jgi:hypothetical protein
MQGKEGREREKDDDDDDDDDPANNYNDGESV